MTNKELGLKIKQLRSQYSLKIGKKFLQKDLAEAVGISRGYIGDIESGRTRPNPDLLGKIVDALDGDIWDVIDNSYDGDIIPSDQLIMEQQAKYNTVSKMIDEKNMIEKWLSENEIKSVLTKIYEKHPFFRDYSHCAFDLAQVEKISSNSDALNNELFLKRINFHRNSLINKIINLVNLEEKQLKESINQFKPYTPKFDSHFNEVIAAHNDNSLDSEQQRLMKEDIDEL
jgi:transcriptional regulator with XRE-family HTH domain